MGVARYAGLLLVLGGCPSTNLLSATRVYATTSDVASAELAATGGILTSICNERAEIEYLAEQLHEAGQPTSFTDFFAHVRHAVPGLDASATWQDQCAAYRAVDLRFSKLLHGVSAYGAALGAFASDDDAAGTPLAAVVKSIGTDVATELPAAAPYKSELAGAGDPIGRIATALQQRWRAKHIGKLVTKVDPDLQLVLAGLDGYLVQVRKREVADARQAVEDLVAALHGTVATGSDRPLRSLAFEQQLVAATLEVELEGRLATFDRRIASLRQVVEHLRAAHRALAHGWKEGEDEGKATLEEIAAMATEIRDNVARFEDPVTGEGS